MVQQKYFRLIVNKPILIACWLGRGEMSARQLTRGVYKIEQIENPIDDTKNWEDWFIISGTRDGLVVSEFQFLEARGDIKIEKF